MIEQALNGRVEELAVRVAELERARGMPAPGAEAGDPENRLPQVISDRVVTARDLAYRMDRVEQNLGVAGDSAPRDRENRWPIVRPDSDRTVTGREIVERVEELERERPGASLLARVERLEKGVRVVPEGLAVRVAELEKVLGLSDEPADRARENLWPIRRGEGLAVTGRDVVDRLEVCERGRADEFEERRLMEARMAAVERGLSDLTAKVPGLLKAQRVVEVPGELETEKAAEAPGAAGYQAELAARVEGFEARVNSVAERVSKLEDGFWPPADVVERLQVLERALGKVEREKASDRVYFAGVKEKVESVAAGLAQVTVRAAKTRKMVRRVRRMVRKVCGQR